MRNCLFASGAAGTMCGVCGFVLTADYATPPRRNCGFPAICIHMGEPRPPVKVACHCPGKAMRDEPAAACDLHRVCLPTYSPSGDDLTAWNEREESALFVLCARCADFTPRA